MEDKKDTRGFRQRVFENWLSPEGRMNRRNFFFHFAGIGCLTLAFIVVFGVFLGGFLNALYEGMTLPDERMAISIGMAAVMLFSLPLSVAFYIFFRAILRRWHDVGLDDRAFLFRVVYPTMTVFSIGFGYASLNFASIPGVADASQTKHFVFGVASFISFFLVPMVLVLYLLVKGSDARDNAFGTVDGASRLASEILLRPVEEKPVLSSIFGYRGRLNRKRFILRLMLVYFPLWLLSMVIMLIPWDRVAGLIGYQPTLFQSLGLPVQPVDLLALVYLVYYVLSMVLVLGLFTQRLHDLGMSGLWIGVLYGCAILLQGYYTFQMYTLTSEAANYYMMCGAAIAIYQAFLTGFVVFVPGDEGANKYGDNPLRVVGAS